MPESRHSSTLDIKVNARALDGLQGKLTQVFSKQTPREFNSALIGVNQRLQITLRLTEDIAKALGRVKDGSSAWKSMADQLQQANREGKVLEGTLARVNRANQQAATLARGGAGGGGGGGTGGGGGGGGRGGGGERGRGFGMGGMQAPMPGMGAIQTALMSIPMAGMVAAGSLMAAAQTYQSRRRYEQARLEASPYLLNTTGALGALSYGGPVTRQVAAQQPPGTSMQGRTVEEVGTGRARRVGEVGLTTAELGVGSRQMIREGLEAGLGKTAGNFISDIAESGFGTGLQEITGIASAGRAVFGQRTAAEAERAKQAAYPSLAETMYPDSMEAARAHIARQREELSPSNPYAQLINKRKNEASVAGATIKTEVTDIGFDRKAMEAAGQYLGYDPTATMQMAGQMAQGAGRRIGAGELEQGLALQRQGVMGVGQTGQTLKSLRHAADIGIGEGRGGDMQQVANMIGSAVALGLSGSEITDYLQEQTGFLDQMAKKGIGLDIDKMRNLETTLAGSGINARWRASELARGFVSGSAEVGAQGPKSASQYRLMRAYGFSGEQGIEEMFKIRMAMQDPELSEQLGLPSPAEAMSKFIEQMRIPGAGRFLQAGVIQSSFREAGLGAPGPQEAMALSQRLQTSKAGEFAIDTEAAARLVSTMAPSEKAEAGIEAGRIGIGAEIAGSMQDLARTTNNMASTFQNVLGGALEKTAERLENFSGWLDQITAEGGHFKPFEEKAP